MTGIYDQRLVGLSVAIAIASSYAALDLAGRVRVHRARARWFWIAGGGSAMGLGIWAMHYIGMLAFHLPAHVLYHIPTVLLSLFAAIVGSVAALITVSRRQVGRLRFVCGSLIMGLAISVVHYVGMEAMRLSADMHFRPGIVALSIALAIGIAGVALRLSCRAKNHERVTIYKISSALLIGLAIPVMHYTGMHAAVFTSASLPVNSSHATEISSLGIYVIIGSTMVVLALVVVAAFVDRLMLAQKAVADVVLAGETNFRNLAEAIPQIIWTADPDAQAESYDVASQWSGCEIEDTSFPLDSCWALRTGRIHHAGTPGAISCAHASGLSSPYICLPVRGQREVVGIMHFQLIHDRDLPELEIAILESFAEQVGLSLANIRLREELRAQSIRDPISGLFNRRYLEESAQRELARALRGKHELGVVMLEIDHFRTFIPRLRP